LHHAHSPILQLIWISHRRALFLVHGSILASKV
jgi:hypothetical protein